MEPFFALYRIVAILFRRNWCETGAKWSECNNNGTTGIATAKIIKKPKRALRLDGELFCATKFVMFLWTGTPSFVLHNNLTKCYQNLTIEISNFPLSMMADQWISWLYDNAEQIIKSFFCNSLWKPSYFANGRIQLLRKRTKWRTEILRTQSEIETDRLCDPIEYRYVEVILSPWSKWTVQNCVTV